ncbi:MAG: LLM class flavin-dependent oxidoreductase [Candidatus Rokubacteria bacterium]|nr:LLM class flavin-dependent oxidoreductase [Candidatus Rokubacteria bacterium]
MEFGIYPSVTRRGGDLRVLFEAICEEAAVAEACGFTWCLVGEHHQEQALTSPLLTAGLIAMRTRRIRVGTAVLLLPLHHPVHVAEQAALIDVLSGGRLVLGVGVGYQPKDFAAFGTTMRHRGALLDEGVEIVRRCWTERGVTFHGQHFTLEAVDLGVRPRQEPSPPIWIGAGSEVGLPRVAAKGDAWLASRVTSLATIRRWASRYRDAAQRIGRPARVFALRDAWVADTRQEAATVYERAMRDSLSQYASNEAYARQMESLLATRVAGNGPEAGDHVILGTPDDCIAQIDRWEEAQVDGLLLRFRHPGGPDQREILDAVRLFGETVIPAVNRPR